MVSYNNINVMLLQVQRVLHFSAILHKWSPSSGKLLGKELISDHSNLLFFYIIISDDVFYNKKVHVYIYTCMHA